MAQNLGLGAGEGDTPPWSTLREVAGLIAPDKCVLIGGLMVEVHARAAGVARNRATDDVDIVVDLAAAGVSAGGVAGALYAAGFRLDERYSHSYRFRRNREIVDVLIPSGMRARLQRRPMLPAQAGRQALQRNELWSISDSNGATFNVRVPTLLGALVLKGAAYVNDPRDNERHLQDVVALLGSRARVGDMDLVAVTSRDRARLRAFSGQLSDHTNPAWFDVDADSRRAGQLVLERIILAGGL